MAEKRNEHGKVKINANLYGMENYPLSQLEAFDGAPTDLYNPEKNVIAAVYMDYNYGEAMTDSQLAKLGDTVKIHHVYEWVFSGAKTGEIIPEEKAATYEGEINVTEKIIWKIIRRLSIQSWISSQRKLMRIRSPNTAIGNVISGMF